MERWKNGKVENWKDDNRVWTLSEVEVEKSSEVGVIHSPSWLQSAVEVSLGIKIQAN